jgi:diguanylate cyclase (GGDEF)-like protein
MGLDTELGVQRVRRQARPRRRVYPVMGVLLSLGAPLGLLLLRDVLLRGWPGVAWVSAEVASHFEIYAYVSLSTLIVFAFLGYLLGQKEDRLDAESTTDALTGLPNRRRFDASLDDELGRANRYGGPLALLLIDVDKLKDINDRGGHEAGDIALRTVAQTLRDTCRTTDLAVRYGGDEFAVLAPQTDVAQGLELAARIQAALEPIRRHPTPHSVAPTLSIGVTEFDRRDRGSAESLCEAADRALYAAKAQGRDRAISIPVAAVSQIRPALSSRPHRWNRT